jgi:rhodanese-related sulfurtransferase
MDPQFDGMIFQTHAAELHRRLHYPFPPFKILDARSREEFRRGHLPGAILVAGRELSSLLPQDGGRIELFVVGRGPGDPRVREVSLALLALGAHRVVELTGGMEEWARSGHETEYERGAAA